MPLSEEERRQLAALEQLLVGEDPALVRAFERTVSYRSRIRTLMTILLITVAFAILMIGIITKLPFIGALGFILMILGGITMHPRRQRNPLSEHSIYARRNIR